MHKFERNLPTMEVDGVLMPIDPSKHVSTKEHFELTYLRWRYFMRASNPSEELIRQYEKAAYKVAKEAFNDHHESMKLSGLEIEDVCNIALVHLISYLGCYSLQFSESGQEKVVEKRKKAEFPDEEVKRKDLSNMMVFIQQRMRDLVRVFKQKNKNVLGEHSVAILYQLIDKEVPCTDLELIKAPDKYGYRRVTPSQYKEVKRKLGTYPSTGKFVIGDIIYRYVHNVSTPIWMSDHEHAEDIRSFNPQPNISPQEEGYELIKRYRMEKLLERYENADLKGKVRMLRKAINFFKKKKMMQELALANRMLNKLECDEAK